MYAPVDGVLCCADDGAGKLLPRVEVDGGAVVVAWLGQGHPPGVTKDLSGAVLAKGFGLDPGVCAQENGCSEGVL